MTACLPRGWMSETIVIFRQPSSEDNDQRRVWNRVHLRLCSTVLRAIRLVTAAEAGRHITATGTNGYQATTRSTKMVRDNCAFYTRCCAMWPGLIRYAQLLDNLCE